MSAGAILAIAAAALLGLAFAAWRRYLWVAGKGPLEHEDTCPYSLTEVYAGRHVQNAPHQAGVRWLHEVFSRSAAKFPDHPALQVPRTGDSLTYAELDARNEGGRRLVGVDQPPAQSADHDQVVEVIEHLEQTLMGVTGGASGLVGGFQMFVVP